MGQMRFDFPHGLVLHFLPDKVVVLSKKPDGGDYLQARHVPPGKRPEMVLDRKGEPTKPAVLADINQLIAFVFTDWKCRHHCKVNRQGRRY